MSRIALLAATLAVACWGGNQDRAAWTRAAGGTSQEAAADCATIADEDLRGECRVDVARRFARTGERGAAEAMCAGIELDLWRHECWFAVTDELGLVGPEAVESCARAVHYRSNCIAHAVHRQVESQPEVLVVGRESALLNAIEAALEVHHPATPAPRRSHQARRMLAGFLGTRWAAADAVVDVADCGVAPRGICAEALRLSLIDDPFAPEIVAACTRGLDGGLPPLKRKWTEASEPMVREVWAKVCRDGASAPPRPPR